jgi:hypothetical protein
VHDNACASRIGRNARHRLDYSEVTTAKSFGVAAAHIPVISTWWDNNKALCLTE